MVRHRDSQTAIEQQDAPALFIDSRDRHDMINLVQRYSETQEQPLQEEILAELGLQKQPSVLNLPCNLSIKREHEPTKPLPIGTRLVDVFEKSGDILILGEGGSGKTTLLQELNRKLLLKAIDDPSNRVPVLFNLSSWAVKQGSLADWLKKQLCDKYSFTPRFADLCVNERVILPLLDGLNEVGEDKILACIQQINTYRRNQKNLAPLIICSRKVENYVPKAVFDSNPVEVEISPLEDQQIEQYISGFGDKLTSLQEALRKDATLRDIARTPLILHILTLASLRTSLGDLHQDTSKDEKSIFAFFTEQMLEYKNKEKYASYRPQKIYHWLKWLAQYMIQQGQKPYNLERMQSPWVPKRSEI